MVKNVYTLKIVELIAFITLYLLYSLIFIPFYLLDLITITDIFLFSFILISVHVLLASIRIWWKYRGKAIEKENAPELYMKVEQLAEKMDVKKPKIIILKENVPNAYATDSLPTKPIVIFTTGLLQELDSNELDAVIAHELSHIKSYDVFFMTIFSALISFLLKVHNGIRYKMFGRGSSIVDIMLLFIPFIVTYISLFIGELIFYLVSRTREYVADSDATKATNSQNMKSALYSINNKIAQLNNFQLRSFSGEKPLCIIPVLSDSSDLFSTHPSLEKRVKNIEKYR